MVKVENGWWVSELRMPLLRTRPWRKRSGRALTGTQCEQSCEFGHEDRFQSQSGPDQVWARASSSVEGRHANADGAWAF